MRTIDTGQLLSTIDLREFLQAELGPPTRGGLWSCPWHEDKSPSFGVVRGRPGLWHCFSCGASGDAISFLRQRHGLTFVQACARLAGGRTMPETLSAARAPARPRIRQAEAAPDAWSARAETIATEAQRALWEPEGLPGLAYLRARGVTDATARAARLGWLAADLRDPAAAWGLPADGKPIWTPAGILIPWLSGGLVQRLNIRRLDPGSGPKYCGPAGWKAGLFNADALRAGKAVVLVEGEFDALAVAQACGDLVSAVAAGSATGGRVASAVYALSGAPVVLLLFDADGAGQEAATWWEARVTGARRVVPSGAKDPASMPPEALRALIQAALPEGRNPPAVVNAEDGEAFAPFPERWLEVYSAEELERLAIQTVDGGLSDVEAEQMMRAGVAA